MEKIKNNLSKIIIVLLAVGLVVLGVSFYNFTISSETKHLESENLRILKLEEENNLRSELDDIIEQYDNCLLYTSPSPRDRTRSRMPSSA